MRARDLADQLKINKHHQDNIDLNQETLNSHIVNFTAIGTVVTMLIENLNMQVESETADLLDRKLISLYGVNQQQNQGAA